MIKGEHIDTAPRAGSNRENTAAWQNLAQHHLPEMRVLQAAGILGWENKDWRNITEHSLVVNGAAMLLAKKLEQAGAAINAEVVDEASLLHDATKRLDKEKGISYATEHGASQRHALLSGFGYSPEVIAATEYTGRVADMFIKDPEQQKAAIAGRPLEQLVVAYADARTRNTDIVPLETARDLNKQKVPADAGIYDQWYSFYKNVEQRIFASAHDQDFVPASLDNESVAEAVRQTAK